MDLDFKLSISGCKGALVPKCSRQRHVDEVRIPGRQRCVQSALLLPERQQQRHLRQGSGVSGTCRPQVRRVPASIQEHCLPARPRLSRAWRESFAQPLAGMAAALRRRATVVLPAPQVSICFQTKHLLHMLLITLGFTCSPARVSCSRSRVARRGRPSACACAAIFAYRTPAPA